jgi:hypothetical protein
VSQRSNGYFAPTVDCNAFNARQRAQRSRARAGGTLDSLQDLSGAPPDSQAGPHARAPTVGTQRPGDVAGAPDSVRWRTGLSGVPPDSVRCTRGLHAELLTFGKIQRRSAIIHRTVRCSKEERLWNSPASGIRSAIIHRICLVCTGLSGETAEQRLLRANGHLQSHLMHARARRSQACAKWRTGHSTVHVRCATGHPGEPSSQSSNGRNPTAW